MANTPINPAVIAEGQPVTTATMDLVRTNLNDHEARLQSIEGSTESYPPIILRVNGPYYIHGAAADLLRTTVKFPLVVLGVRLIIDRAGSTGITQIDIRFKRGAGAWTSLLTSQPSVDAAVGDDATSTNGVLNPAYTILQAGDLLRLDTTSVQTGGYSFMVRIDYVKA